MISSTKDGARGRRRTRAVITTAGALVAAAALAGPAGAAAPPPGHTLISFPQRDFVSDQGFSASDGPVIVEVVRNGATIATSTPVNPADDPKTPNVFDGLVEVNHPGGGCWVGTTPDILPGDTIRMTANDGAGFSEETRTANVTAQPAGLVGADVVVHGTAQDASGNPLPIDQIEQRIVANKQAFAANGRRTLRADSTGTSDGILAYDPVDPVSNPKGVNWTATYTGLISSDQTLATTNETRALWLGANPALLNEGTIYETSLDGSIVAGPATPDCSAPLALNAIGATKIGGALVSVINQNNVGGTLTVSGAYDAVNVSAVTLTVAGANVPVTLGADTWTASVPAASLPEGTVTLTASFTKSPTGGGAPDNTMTIVKDTVAPAAPTANLAGGTFAGPQTLILSGTPGTTIRFTGDGSTPTATSGVVFSAPFSITASQTITAVAVDNHGNASVPSRFAFTIAGPIGAKPPVVVPTGPTRTQTPTGQVGGVKSSSLAVSRLSLARRISISRLRAQGLRASMSVQEGTNVVRIAIYKTRNGVKTGRAVFTTIRTPRSAGLFRVTLRSSKLSKLKPGLYAMEVRAGRSAASLGAARTTTFRVTR